MNEEKDRLKKKVVDTGLPMKDLRPSYFHPILWDELLKFWDSEVHKHRSDVGAKNREKVQTLHSAGAKAFEAIEMEMTRENKGKKPRRLELWDRTHTIVASRKANKGKKGGRLVYTTPAAMEMAARYGAILEREGADLSPASELIEPIDWWLHATSGGIDKPKKIRSLASSRHLDNEELEDLARNLVDISEPESRGNLNTVFFREVVNVVTTILNDICNKYEDVTRATIEEANQEFTEGESSENEEYLSEDGAGAGREDGAGAGREDGAGMGPTDGEGHENDGRGDAEM
ncbi:hypothetical protein POM88_028606 [Heracleum sosnowskyi]|uniref:Uncharacterized protein n=1 Tax=Heracleum sosnowskyi TaxID=360622 RepID=A0AAD8HT63_9APIA|nr:hypothetical protein POM88_028606 [Heracleum sosnowskyi]